MHQAPGPLGVLPRPHRPQLLRLIASLAVTLSVAMVTSARAEMPAFPETSPVPRQFSDIEVGPWQSGDYTIVPLAGYDVTARVLSTRSYQGDRESQLSPIDFALGWGSMADRQMLGQLQVRQDNRWYFVRWRNAPIKASDVIVNSANTHLMPANPEVAAQLAAVQPGDMVRLRGYLVRAEGKDGWSWTSSLSRADTGDGSCEVLWVESVEIYSDEPIAYAAIE